MPSPFHGIETASRALRAFQRSLDTIGHNVANVNTPGYSRQTVDLSVSDPIQYVLGDTHSLGTGVNMAGITRIRDQFLDARLRDSYSELGRQSAMGDGSRRVESLFLDASGQGVVSALDAFYNSWSALSSNPNDPSNKVNVQTAGLQLSRNIRNIYTSLQGLENQQMSRTTEAINKIQNLANEIATLNAEVRQSLAAGGYPNDVRDKRDAALSELSKMIDIRTQEQSDGSISVYMNQFTMVDSIGARNIAGSYNAATNSLSDANGTYTVDAGELRGMFDSLNFISDMKSRLDTFANTLRTEVNALHMSGTNSAGNTNVRFFNDATPQTGAVDFDLDPAVSGDYNAIVTGMGAPGDGSIALGLSQMRDRQFGGLGNKSFRMYYGDILSDVGRSVKTAADGVATQRAVIQQVEKQVADVSGVSIDEELTNMLKFQRSYQAAAKTLTIMDEVLQDVINMLRR